LPPVDAVIHLPEIYKNVVLIDSAVLSFIWVTKAFSTGRLIQWFINKFIGCRGFSVHYLRYES